MAVRRDNRVATDRQTAPKAFACSEPKFKELASDVARIANTSPGQLLQAAEMANFLSAQGGQVRPAIRLLARLAAVAAAEVNWVLGATRLLDVVRLRIDESTEGLHVYWCRVEEESRAQLSDALLDARRDLALVPIVVRRAVFVDPNAILSDLNGLLTDNRDAVQH